MRIVCMFVLAAGQLSAQQFQYKQCETNLMSMAVNQNEVLLPRLPDTQGLNASPTCKNSALVLRAQWEAEDRNQWEQLSNRACSAKLGWIAKQGVDGTWCSAGGPPPICPRTDHWYRDPINAFAAWTRDNKTKAYERQVQLAKVLCNCWLDEAKDKAAHSAGMNSNYIPGDQPVMVVPCDGSCPIPGHDCIQGVCRPQGTYSTLRAETKKISGEMALETAKTLTEKALVEAIGLVSESLKATIEAADECPVAQLAKLFDGPSEGISAQIYEGEVRKFQNQLTQFQNEVRLYYQYRSSPGQEVLFRTSVLKLRTSLQERIAMMNEAKDGVVRERSLGKYACYDVLDFQNANLNAAFARMLGVSALPSVAP